MALLRASVVLLLSLLTITVAAQGPLQPRASVVPAPPIRLSGGVDSNSPAVWVNHDGRPELRVLTSTAGQISIAAGPDMQSLEPPHPVVWVTHPGHGVWMESVVVDESGTWYGYYHNEVPAEVCGRQDRVIPRVGAARSVDAGETWEDLGIVLEAPPGWHECATRNRYFMGGVGDATALLAPDGRFLYLFFSQYSRFPTAQGVALARLDWAGRDEPSGRVEVWANGVWLPAHRGMDVDEWGDPMVRWWYDAGSPLWPVARPWHDGEGQNDVLWGASVHWNTNLERYVMLLNRAKDDDWHQDGVFVSFSPTLADPFAWSPPTQLLSGGTWYPQVVGLETGAGTDRLGSGRTRLFIGGVSNYVVDFAFK